jgi:ATP-dependent DNA helicase RecQ
MSNEALQILQQYWGYPAFRPLQNEIVESVLKGNDSFVLFPTGGGKSLCFQVPALVKPGVCLVVTPLIALMKDQVDDLHKRGISAVSLHSGLTRREIDIILENCKHERYKFLYVSPERLKTEMFKIRLNYMNISIVAIDEAHCVSQWGYDFRPPYMEIAQMREFLPSDVPFIALTATATPEVVTDIIAKLELKNPKVFRQSFARKNISYNVVQTENKLPWMKDELSRISGSGLVYVRNRRTAVELDQWLQKQGISCSHYHAGLSKELRISRQEDWLKGSVKVMVCTNAFGMGINKPDVRLVIHYQLPDCIENYFQEAGRAGRDGQPSIACLLFEPADRFELEQFVQISFPTLEIIQSTYTALGNYYQIAVGMKPERSFSFDISNFCETYKMKPLVVINSIRFLEKEDYVAYNDDVTLGSRLKFETGYQTLYEFQVFHKEVDPLIKLLLRSYQGIFDQFATIDESNLGKKLGTTTDKIKQMLDFMEKKELISYLPKFTKPQLSFTKERQDKKAFHLQEENYQFLKTRAIERMRSMINFVEGTHVCRNVFLLHYLGETGAKECGICDVCRRKNPQHTDAEIVAQTIAFYVKKSPLHITKLPELIHWFLKEQVIAVSRWMIDNDYLLYYNGLIHPGNKIKSNEENYSTIPNEISID